MGSTENFWKAHSIKSGRDQPGNPKEQGEDEAPGEKARREQFEEAEAVGPLRDPQGFAQAKKNYGRQLKTAGKTAQAAKLGVKD